MVGDNNKWGIYRRLFHNILLVSDKAGTVKYMDLCMYALSG